MRLSHRLIITGAATASIVGAGLGVGLTPAFAAGAPSCVHSTLNDSGWTDHLTVRNNCGSYQRVKVILANHSDLACRTIAPNGGSYGYSWDYPGRFDRLESC